VAVELVPPISPALDPSRQIRLFAKLKIMNCAIWPGWETTPGICLIKSGAIRGGAVPA
jgi:hypothetical protein